MDCNRVYTVYPLYIISTLTDYDVIFPPILPHHPSILFRHVYLVHSVPEMLHGMVWEYIHTTLYALDALDELTFTYISCNMMQLILLTLVNESLININILDVSI